MELETSMNDKELYKKIEDNVRRIHGFWASEEDIKSITDIRFGSDKITKLRKTK
jgi:hypothetical protein